MQEEIFKLVTFDSTHYAIGAEKALNENDIQARLIPIYSEISAGCGLAAKISAQEENKVRNILNNKNIQFNKLYLIKKQGFKKEITIIG